MPPPPAPCSSSPTTRADRRRSGGPGSAREAHGTDDDAFIGPSGRRCGAEEQAWPLLFLNSSRLTYVAAEALQVDGGFLAAMTTGQL